MEQDLKKYFDWINSYTRNGKTLVEIITGLQNKFKLSYDEAREIEMKWLNRGDKNVR